MNYLIVSVVVLIAVFIYIVITKAFMDVAAFIGDKLGIARFFTFIYRLFAKESENKDKH